MADESNAIYELQMKETLEDELNLGKLRKVSNVTGGIVNKANLFETEDKSRRIFVKYSSRDNALDMFESEFQSINDIKVTNTIQVPNPIKVLKHPDRGAMFALEWIENLKPIEKLWSKLGEQVADLHLENPKKLAKEGKEANVVGKYEKSTAVKKFGYNYSTYMGPTFKLEANVWFDDWPTCFIQYWLKPQFDEAEKKFGNRELSEKWSLLERKLPEIFKDTFFWPSLNHGDLCTINVGETNGNIIVYDPMCSYSPLEADHAIINLEKNFGEEFEEIYWKKTNNYVSKEKLNLRMELYKIFALVLCSIAENDQSMLQSAIKIIHSIVTI